MVAMLALAHCSRLVPCPDGEPDLEVGASGAGPTVRPRFAPVNGNVGHVGCAGVQSLSKVCHVGQESAATSLMEDA